MKKIIEKYTLLYCVVIGIVVLGAMMGCGTLIERLFRDTGVDGYVVMALQELCGAILAMAAMRISGCIKVLTERGIGLGKGLLVGGYFLFVGVYSAILYLVTYEGEKVLRPWYLIAAFLICMFLVGVTEEILCRGIIAELLCRRYGASSRGVWKAVIISGVIFGLLHASNMLSAEPSGVIVQIVLAGMMGMTFAAIYFRSGNIWVVVCLHAFVDISALITTGLYGGSLVDTISGYEFGRLVGVVPYIIVIAVLLRKKKMKQIVARLEETYERDARLES